MQPPTQGRRTHASTWSRRVALATLVMVVAAVSTGCVPEAETTLGSSADVSSLPGRPAPGSTPRPTSNEDGGVTYCGGVTISIPDGAGEYRLAGECPEVHINGNDLRIDATGAEVGVVDISGDRNVFEADMLPKITLHGQDNRVTTRDVGSVDVNGDRNVVESAGSIASASIHGNENTLIGIVAEPVLEGTGNQVVRPGG